MAAPVAAAAVAGRAAVGARAATSGGGRVAASGRHAATRQSTTGPKHAAPGQAGRDAKQIGQQTLIYPGKAKAKGKAKGGGGGSGAARALLAEFVICVILLGLSPLSRPDGETRPADWIRRGTAISAVFMMLGMVSAIGPRSGRAAAALGGLITLALLVDQRAIFGEIARRMGHGEAELPPVGPPDEEMPR